MKNVHPNASVYPTATAMKALSQILRSPIATLPVVLCAVQICAGEAPIDRHALVTRHNVVLHEFDAKNPLSVGNGDFAFTVDATGLQSFPDAFTNTTPLGTLSDWGWHTGPNPEGWSPEKYHQKEFDVFGRKVPYNDMPGNKGSSEAKWLRANPHRLDLGQIGFLLKRSDGSLAQIGDLTAVEQTLDLWGGIIVSRFKMDGEAVEVQTVCDPDADAIGVRVKSSLLKSGALVIRIAFPYGTGDVKTADWDHPDAHETVFSQDKINVAHFARKLDNDSYVVNAKWSLGATITNTAKHTFLIVPDRKSAELEFACAFAPKDAPKNTLPEFARIEKASREHWERFWKTGGAIDLSGSTDPRWFELERRIVLSQYLTAIQCAGTTPPQETGLTYNSWEGKFHLEMHWWHAAHFALWNRVPLLEKSLGYYDKILSKAQETAKRQGYAGARWPKMTDPSGVDSPSPIGPFLIWQQPHPIFYAELCYRAHPNKATLEKFRTVIEQTAEFMASYPEWEPSSGTGTSPVRLQDQTHGQDAHATNSAGRYVLGPVLQCAQEIFPKTNTLNPTFELTYWRWALETAQQWRQRLGLPRKPKWDRVLSQLAKPTLEEGKYLFAETATGTYTDKKWTDDHPSVTASFGMLPGPGIDRDTMRRTLEWIWPNWNWPDTWGWDYGMLAMCAARLGEPDRAIDALLLDTPKNHVGINGHNYQRPGLTIYLPGNGSLLYATAMMAAGWDGGPKINAPGFPKNGKWKVRCENLQIAP